ncbi:hypothetical protein [Hydrogenophaga sp. 2FB]|uniref:hypothetical protein n=1 Tax=Hydrogenophaga sp. 2FB TaxID=2502187 RepID=UPI0010F91EFD|nr:hypothetical protein [Hydrogenophaga sp. 2FB]
MSSLDALPPLADRCAEIIHWHRTGVLEGDALRTMAAAQKGDLMGDLRIAEGKTALEAMALVVAHAATAAATVSSVA